MPTRLEPADQVDDDLRARWAALVATDPTATPFLGPVFLDAYRSSLGGGATHERWAMEDADGLVATAGHEVRDGVLRFAGGSEVTDYQGLVAAPTERAAAARAWVGDLAERVADGAVERAELEGMPADAPGDLVPWPDLLADAAADAGLVPRREVHEVCPRVDLSDGYDAWLEGLDGRQRQELKRKARKLGRDLGGVAIAEADDHDAALARFLEMAATDETAKGDFFRQEAMRDWFADLVAAFDGSDELRFHELVAGGVPAASMVSLVAHGEWSLYNSAFDARLGPMGVGMVLTGELVRVAAEEGADAFDFLRGDEAYKYQFGAGDRDLVRLTLGSP